MTDLEARLRAVPRIVCTIHVSIVHECHEGEVDWPALTAVVQGMFAEQAREVERLTTILGDVLADTTLSHQQITRLEGEVERLREAVTRYADHQYGCAAFGTAQSLTGAAYEIVNPTTCTCGFDGAFHPMPEAP